MKRREVIVGLGASILTASRALPQNRALLLEFTRDEAQRSAETRAHAGVSLRLGSCYVSSNERSSIRPGAEERPCQSATTVDTSPIIGSAPVVRARVGSASRRRPRR